MARLPRLERGTYGLEVRCSIQLSYTWWNRGVSPTVSTWWYEAEPCTLLRSIEPFHYRIPAWSC